MKNVRFAVTLSFLCLAPLPAYGQTADKWKDISSAQIGRLDKQPWPGGCAGVAVNRSNGDVMVNFVGFGLWKSSNQGQTWTRLDKGVIGGRGESGWSVQVDQNDPKRVAVFSLDGDAGYTIDGTHWKKFTGMGRNWDFGSVDWASPGAQVILAGKHESGGEVYKSLDGGTTWAKLPIIMNPVTNKDNCMIGVMDAKTFVYSFANGIQRSTDQGGTWSKVSAFQPRSKIPVLFKGLHYLCTSNGLIVSKNHGATWQTRGASLDLWQGPFFGADEKTMVAAGPQGVFKTTNAGTTWTRVSALRSNLDPLYTYATKWFGCYSWDPINDVIYATAMSHPAFKNHISGTAASAAELPRPHDPARTGVWTDVTPAALNLTPTYDPSGNYGVNDVLADPARPGDFYAFVNYQGVWKSTDFGVTWAKISAKRGPLDLGRAWGEAIDKNPKRDPTTPPRMYACQGYGPQRGVWVSTNGGIDWTRYSQGGKNDHVYNFDTDPNDCMHVISANHDDDHCYESTDGGVTWVDKGRIAAGAVTGTHSSYVWFITADAWLAVSESGNGRHGTFRTADRGATWTNVLQAEHAHGANQIFIDNGGVIYLPHTDGIHKSIDQGLTWTQVSRLQASSVVATPSYLYASYGFPLLSHKFNPNLQRAPRATGTPWSTGYAPPPAMINGTKRAAVSCDGKHYVIVSGNWCAAGIWRYVEPKEQR